MLHLDSVSFLYPGVPVGVRDVSLEVKPGELVAVIGASGSGKTTLLNLLAGFLTPSRGRVVIDGKDVSAMPPEKRNLGIVFQSYGLFPHLRAWENVAYPLKVRGVPLAQRRERALEALRRVGMGNRAENGPRELSGGQQQRVALARALVFQPRGLLLDEPLSALDANLRVEMRDEILRVQRAAGIAALLVTHDQEEALSIADRVAVMREGRLVQVAPPRELYDAPADEETARFVGEANLWRGSVVADGCVRTPVGDLTCNTRGHAVDFHSDVSRVFHREVSHL
ncbi:ABC transporter ATP-binding protein [Devosia sp.]|uniref:ABC transporter ATP-binding protein n=1 Tax=Devosia sp. TaxID=1871048 RepID=UPI001AC827C7|nr:ABC transporter ATP-binding protein [Devosia sp.]MBN9309838.1 ABC transporter ATP-binding protein [Devosia sp.]